MWRLEVSNSPEAGLTCCELMGMVLGTNLHSSARAVCALTTGPSVLYRKYSWLEGYIFHRQWKEGEGLRTEEVESRGKSRRLKELV